MFDKEVVFLVNGIYIQGVGRVYSGKKMSLPNSQARVMVANGYAEYSLKEEPKLKPPAKKKGKKDVDSSESRESEVITEDNE